MNARRETLLISLILDTPPSLGATPVEGKTYYANETKARIMFHIHPESFVVVQTRQILKSTDNRPLTKALVLAHVVSFLFYKAPTGYNACN